MTNLRLCLILLVFAGIMTAWSSGALDGQSPTPTAVNPIGGLPTTAPSDRSIVSDRLAAVPTPSIAVNAIEPLVAISRYSPVTEPTIELLARPRLIAELAQKPAPGSDQAMVERIDSVVQRLEALESTIRNLNQRHQADLDQIHRSLADLSNRLDRVESLMKPHATMAPPAVAPSPPMPTATLHLANDFDIDVTIVVNAINHPLAPGKAKSITIPAGEYMFQVLPWHTTPQPRTIEPGEERPLRVFRR